MLRFRIAIASLAVLLASCLIGHAASPASTSRGAVYLSEGWSVQSSAKISAKGGEISLAKFRPEGWLHATIPATVVAAELQNGLYPDLLTGMNFRKLPSVTYPIGADFGNMPMPADSPYAVSWWYRKEFTAPPAAGGRRVTLHFDGITYRANVWVNGHLIADKSKVAGTFRVYEFDVTPLLVPGRNALAVEVFPTQLDDLGIHWVDWSPAPPDKNMGLWHDAYLTTSGAVIMRYPFVASKVEPDLKTAHLTVIADVRNLTEKPLEGTLEGEIGAIRFSKKVALAAGETKKVACEPAEFPQLDVKQPALWWPTQMGPQNLHTLSLKFIQAARQSDEKTLKFGIREVTSELTPEGYRLFRVNGRRVLIKGAAWAPDMLLRVSRERQDAQLRYAKDLNINTIRLEGKLEDEHFYEVCDREGLLVMPGWCCCDHWERTEKWGDEQKAVAEASMRDQARRLRGHPSVFVWLYGSDKVPAPEVEKIYVRALDEERWPNPSLSSATAAVSEVTGPSGVKMTGPYEYVPPMYWYADTKRGGAYGYNTETCPGPAVPPIESLRKMLGEDHLWPMDDTWVFHAGSETFKTLGPFTDAINNRYGLADSADDFAKKAQALAYETHRAMFEAYIRNKYHSTGVIQWLQNNAWPSLIWHLYDYYLRPGGSYFGAKKANEPLHIQYSYDDRSVAVVNSFYQEFKGLKVSVKVLNPDLAEKFSLQETVDVPEDGVVRVLTVPEIEGLQTTYFVSLLLSDSAGKPVSRNFYWLSTKPDVLDHERQPMPWQYTPVKEHADVKALASLPRTTLRATVRVTGAAAGQSAHVTVRNTGQSLAFFTHLALFRDKDQEEVLPILWEDNYFALMPGEERTIGAKFSAADAQGPLKLRVTSWNSETSFIPVRAATAAAKAE